MKTHEAAILTMTLTGILSAQVANVAFETEVNPIFASAGCTASSCHGGGAGGLNLGTGAAANYGNIVSIASSCSGLNYIEPGSPSTSHLYKKIAGTQTCGSRMPRNNPGYFDSNQTKLETIRVWIEEGALFEPLVGVEEAGAATVPTMFALNQNYPNPFNPATNIEFQLQHDLYIALRIVDLAGQEVRLLTAGHYGAGQHKIVWDGRDNSRREVASGVYISQLQGGAHRVQRKLLLIR